MRPLPIPKTASQVIKNFRTRELQGLMYHLRLHGPLPTEGVPDNNKNSLVLPNPFVPRKNPKTGKWRNPRYSLRRQADLVKRAKDVGQLHVVPPGPKLFAMELRMRRVQASLSPPDAQLVRETTTAAAAAAAEMEAASSRRDEVFYSETEPELLDRMSGLKSKLQKRQDELKALEGALEGGQSQRELDELADFEESGSDAERQLRRERQAERLALERDVAKAQKRVATTSRSVEDAHAYKGKWDAHRVREGLWANPVWVGDVKRKATEGEELGIRLYAGKKRMFKGHLWEKEKLKRLSRQRVLMRDMKTRVERYKSYYKKRKSNPLKPSRLPKQPKLPF